MASSRLINASRMNAARTLTLSSPVSGIKNLSLWLETTSLSSFDSEPQNNDPIQNWHDLSPQNSSRFTASQSTSTKRPLYKTGVFNGLPALVFDDTDDDMLLGSNFSAGSNTSYFFVVQPSPVDVSGIFDSAPNRIWVFRNLCDTPYYASCPGDGSFSWWNGSNPTPQAMLGLSGYRERL